MDVRRKFFIIGSICFLSGVCAAFFFSFFVPAFSGRTFLTGRAISQPSDFFDERALLLYSDKLVLPISGAQVHDFAATGSMTPTLGARAQGVSIVPDSVDDITVGDIVLFRSHGVLIAHRVVERNIDAEGVYFVTKGDAVFFTDGKIRFSDIERVIVAVVY